MKVITLDNKKLTQYSQKLAIEILKSKYQPDLIIGIQTGGAFVSKPLYTEITKHYKTAYCEVGLSRPLSHKKKKFNIKILLQYFPYVLLNFMRNLEVFIYELFKSQKYGLTRQNEIIIDIDTVDCIKKAKNILLVDDAIDSGATLLEVKTKILSLNKNTQIKTAVLTSTHKSSYIDVDFSIFKRVLLRCPWSNDYKENK